MTGERKAGPNTRFDLVFALLLLLLVMSALLTVSRFFAVALVSIQALLLLLLLRGVTASRRARWSAGSVIVLVALATIALEIPGEAHGLVQSITAATTTALVAAGPFAITGALRHERAVTLQTVFGALSLYLFIGLFYALLYRVVSLAGTPFFVQTDTPTSIDFLYFSCVTIATLGYGDLTPATGLGKMLAVSETLLGQLYLVTVVALLVSNIGREKRPPESDADPQ